MIPAGRWWGSLPPHIWWQQFVLFDRYVTQGEEPTHWNQPCHLKGNLKVTVTVTSSHPSTGQFDAMTRMMDMFDRMQTQAEARYRAEREEDARRWQVLMQQQEERMQELKFKLKSKRDDPSMGKGIPKHQKLNDTDDIDVFMSTFQSHMTNFKVHKRDWVPNLVPLLTDRIRDVYATLDDAVRNDYNKVKDAILDYFNVTPDTYRRKYKEARKNSSESWVDFVQKLLLLKGKWTKDCTSAQAVRDVTTMEDAISLMPDRAQTWVWDQIEAHFSKESSTVDQVAETGCSKPILISRGYYSPPWWWSRPARSRAVGRRISDSNPWLRRPWLHAIITSGRMDYSTASGNQMPILRKSYNWFSPRNIVRRSSLHPPCRPSWQKENYQQIPPAGLEYIRT